MRDKEVAAITLVGGVAHYVRHNTHSIFYQFTVTLVLSWLAVLKTFLYFKLPHETPFIFCMLSTWLPSEHLTLAPLQLRTRPNKLLRTYD